MPPAHPEPQPPPGTSAAERDALSDPVVGPRDEYDAPAEVDAVFRTQRRIAVGYFLVFVGGIVLIPLATLATVWWGDRLTGWAPGFVIAGAGLYLFFFLLALGASTLANGVERRMLGSPDDEDGRDAGRGMTG